ncbi:MAG: aminoacyl-tRNA hydrolase [Dehalococcoidales bacterium]|nr:aminoacyl-tRNA hydrolase [Dehalococcoidales bacterium]
MKLIVGLGNPGFLYALNRHNIGFMCVRHLARTHKITFDRKQGHARTGIGRIGRYKVVLARPQTYMNASGESVNALLKRLNVRPADLIVIHDDLDLPVGKIRLRLGGSSGGHKGIDSIITRTGTQDFYRVRVGVGRPEEENGVALKEEAVIGYVLSDFTPEEKKIIDETIPKVGEAIAYLLSAGLSAAMNKYN